MSAENPPNIDHDLDFCNCGHCIEDRRIAAARSRFGKLTKSLSAIHPPMQSSNTEGLSDIAKDIAKQILEGSAQVANAPQAEPTPIANDPVNHPKHYMSHPSGVECIRITEHMGFNLGNAMKYVWRADEKGNAIQDMEKAIWYIQREIAKRRREGPNG